METADSLTSQIDAEISKQRERITSLALAAALATIATAAWYMWPALDGDAILFERLGTVGLLLTAALLLQDLAELDARARSRLGAVASLAWPAFAILGTEILATSGTVRIGHGLMFIVSAACLYGSRELLRGSLDAHRFRGLMTLGGATIGGAVMLSDTGSGNVLMLSGILIGIVLMLSGRDLFSGDDDRAERKRFGRHLDQLELRILELQAQGTKLDQASSLCRNAADVGYKDPEHGFNILEEAEEDIERTLALASDISDIRNVCAETVDQAEEIAPLAKKPQRSMTAGDRERDLGSLREAEMLYRRAKKLALNIIEHWVAAENSITEASLLIADLQGSQHQQLHELLMQAKEAMAKENCSLALEIADTIPEHVASLGEASEGADTSVEDARQILAESEGLDLSLWEERMTQASAHLDNGEFSLARGLSDGIIREVRKEREAMGDVQRALRQKKAIKKRWKDNTVQEEWDQRLSAVEQAAKRQSWSHAAALLDRLTSDLDQLDAASGDANELLTYVQEEWTALRKKLESAGIKAIDGERAETEKAVANATAALDKGDIETCLNHLGQADALLERLRRRV